MEKFILWVFLARFKYMTSFHALGQVHIYTRSQGNKKINAKEMLKILLPKFRDRRFNLYHYAKIHKGVFSQ